MKAIPNTLFVFLLLITGLSACQKNAAQTPAKLSLAEIETLFKECAPVNGGPVYSIHHGILQNFSERLKEASNTAEATKNIYTGVKTEALDKLGAELPACMSWQAPAPIDDKLCKQFIDCQKELFPYSEPVKSGRPKSSGADDIEVLFKTCATVNGGPVYPLHNYVFSKMTNQLGARPDNLDAMDAIYPQLRAEAEAKLRERLPACLGWQNFDGTDEALCRQFIECQKDIFPYEAK